MIGFQQLFTRERLFVFLRFTILLVVFFGIASNSFAHGVTSGDKGYIKESVGALPIPFIYLGAKHMMTGYDHLLFLFGVIFFLYRLKDISIYVT
ncbi:MAG: HupE/UreJ family protein, partial [Blastocatellia bacterium]|nr:HupE/UreJ family protein [Blastocatellia bacterium]